VVAEVRERLAVTKRVMQNFHVEKYCVNKLNEAESKEWYQVKILNRFTTSEDFDDDEDINRTCEDIGEDIQIFRQREM
jgi:hypothetical protein